MAPSDSPHDSHLKNLTIKAEASKISDVPVHTFMHKNPLNIPEGTKIYSAIFMLAAHHVGSAPVVNAAQKIVGVISEHDLLIQTATRDVAAPITFTRNPFMLKPESTLQEALVLLYKHKVRRLPVVDLTGSVVGLITRMDVLARLIGKRD